MVGLSSQSLAWSHFSRPYLPSGDRFFKGLVLFFSLWYFFRYDRYPDLMLVLLFLPQPGGFFYT